ncbi:MAG: AAA family ATPase, partial [Gammaproteobacteria bacterium]|nr:AAA family ATPase [Gammaproteobacteria bacterium]
HMRRISDLLTEADHWAQVDGAKVVAREHVRRAIEQQIHRLSRMRERLLEAMLRETLLIDTQGEKIGQINGLSVLRAGDFSFGQPSRITATARMGKGEVVDIQREAELGGAIHSKGVMILSAYLGARYAAEQPLSLSASLVFEQTYGLVDGDSASVAELCALLSALAGTPIRQTLAVTGSVNQLGQVQAIGGVNEKIEAFYDLCRSRGLSGEHGVLIPRANVKHLMLRQDIVEAAQAGQFQVYAVDTIDQALEWLTGCRAGEADSDGVYPSDSVNGRVAAQLEKYTQQMKEFAARSANE